MSTGSVTRGGSRLARARRVVVKIGSALLVERAAGRVNRAWLESLAEDVTRLRKRGQEVVIVSSGAIALGRRQLDLAPGRLRLEESQASAAVGQIRLAHAWKEVLEPHGFAVAQMLLTLGDTEERRRYLNARSTLETLLKLGAIPVVNENDTVATAEIRYGDNDRLAALIAHNIGAAVLVLLTDLDGLYTADPRAHPDAALVSRVNADDPLLAIRAGGRSGSGRGSGGMAGKLEAARIASWSGVRTVIANAARPGVVAGAIADEPVGTSFEAHRRKLSARKLWIAFASRVAGTVTVDDGARRALVERPTSLLPAGVVDVAGRFGEGDTVDVAGTDGVPFARGMVFVEAAQLRKVAGRHTSELPPGMVHEVIHRDDLVLLPG